MRVCGYVRLSRDDNKENYDSIITQKKIIKEYANRAGHEVSQFYEDDNVSGYADDSFRPAFNQLKKDIIDGKLDILIAKDLSRIGRHNANTLLFLEFLKEYDVRLILASENYDSSKDDDDIIGIKTWYNERYVKDISKKIKDNIRIKQRQEDGFVIREHFGYKKDKNNKHKLVIDEETEPIIKLIFKLYLEGNGARKIAQILNERKIICPSDYYNIKNNCSFRTSKQWEYSQISRIIKNDIYIGTLRCGKSVRKKIKGATKQVEKSEHIIHENHHPAIISKEEFQLAQHIAERRCGRRIRAGKQGINLFTGYLFCGDCGSTLFMKRYNSSERPLGYVCGKYNNFGRKVCNSHYIQEKKLVGILVQKLKELIDTNIISLEKIDNKIAESRKLNKNYDKIVETLKKKISNKKDEIKNYARQLAKNQITEEIYLELTDDAGKELNLLNNQLREVSEFRNASGQSKEKIIKSTDILKELIEANELNRKDIEILLNKITVYQLNNPTARGQRPELNIEIEWNTFINSMCSHNQVNVPMKYSEAIHGLEKMS